MKPMIRLVALLVLGVASGTAAPAAAEVFRFVSPDGTVHFTNTPTDPRYRRAGLVSPAPRAPIGAALGSGPPYVQEIGHAATQYGIPEELIHAVIRVESGYNPRAVSHKGARGLMQLMPETAAELGVRNVLDPRENIDAGARHLRKLVERFGDLPLVLAAYNAGEQAVLAWRGIPPFPETQDYVIRVLQRYNGASPVPIAGFRTFVRDGTVVYTNLRPVGRLF
jgi:soluble lytic murein transglycosylase-like protein